MNQKTTFLRLLSVLFIGLTFAINVNAQVTSAAINGSVVDSKGEALPGATVVAIHEPSGTKYGGVTNTSGRYNFPSVRVGGPFKVTVSFVGFKEETKSGIITSLGSTSNIDFKLS